MWIKDTNMHIHVAKDISEKEVLTQATKFAELREPDHNVFIDTHFEGVSNNCPCGAPSDTNKYQVILYQCV